MSTEQQPTQPEGATGDAGLWERLGALGGVFTAAAGVFAAIAYVGINLAVESVYSVAGVDPSEIGLGDANLLPASAVVIAIVVGPLVVMAAYGFAMTTWFNSRRRRRLAEHPDWADLESPGRRSWVNRAFFFALLGGALYSAGFAYFFVFPDVRSARDDLLAGRTHDALGPWEFNTAVVTWLDDAATRPELADCMLFLGTGGSTAVFYDPEEHQTLRLPAADLFVASDTDVPKCGRD
jgi:hypothetical protein